jgi:hypothetical protein
MDENHCRVLGAYSRSDLEINLDHCRITGAGASALAEALGRNQGPTKLDLCDTDNSILANGLRGNSRLKILRQYISRNLEVGNQEVLAIAFALKESKGLDESDLQFEFVMSNETWDAICDSLKTHPTLQILYLWSIRAQNWALSPPVVVRNRMQALLDMLNVNMSINTIHWDSRYSDRKIFHGAFIPYLETNRHRPRVIAIQNTRPSAYRAKVLGRALLAVRADPNRFWMLLSGNPEVAFPPTTATTEPAENLVSL